MYYAKLQEAQQLTTSSEKLKMFSEFQELFPRALAPRRLPLTFATGELRDFSEICCILFMYLFC
jgi:peptide alpha-N-acetyltransferase